MSEPKEGWGWPLNSRKAHYFVKGRSLCGKWMFFGRLQTEGDDGSETSNDCKGCLKKLRKRRQEE